MSAPVDEVSDNINWTTRVAKELNADGEWFENGWGEIFARDVPRAPADKIAKIEKELHECVCGRWARRPSPRARSRLMRGLPDVQA